MQVSYSPDICRIISDVINWYACTRQFSSHSVFFERSKNILLGYLATFYRCWLRLIIMYSMPMQCNSRHNMCSIVTLPLHLPASPLHLRILDIRTCAFSPLQLRTCEIQIIYTYNRQGPHQVEFNFAVPSG